MIADDEPRARTPSPEPPAYEPVEPDPVELEMLRQLEIAHAGHPGQIIPEEAP